MENSNENIKLDRPSETPPAVKKRLFGWLKTVGFAVCIGLLVTTVIKPTIVKGNSMQPTIKPQDYLIVNKLPYLAGTPKHGDIVVFKTDIHVGASGSDNDENHFIKRVIGIAGDVVEIKEKKVYLNGEELTEDYLNNIYMPHDMEAVTVSENHIFVMGDNRWDSLDSRNPILGEVAISNIWGRADLRLFPFERIGFI